jgi:glutathione S-transferase
VTSSTPTLTFHVLSISHPCLTVLKAAELKGLEHEVVALTPGSHRAAMQEVYGEGQQTVPGMLVDGETVHGSRPILERLEVIRPSPALYPDPIADAVRDAERWGDEELQDLGRRLPWGALHFRPEAVGTFGGAGPLDAAGTDFAIKVARNTWKYHGISAVRLADDLAGLPAKLDHVDALADAGVIGGEEATAADLQIGATLRVLLTIGDLEELLTDRPAERIARRWFPEYAGAIPAGAFPAGWVPPRT